jgi:zinc protease
VFESDDQTSLARRYGEGVALGRSIADIDAVPSRIQAIGLDDIKRAANEFLSPERSVTGTLTPPPVPATVSASPAALPPKR